MVFLTIAEFFVMLTQSMRLKRFRDTQIYQVINLGLSISSRSIKRHIQFNLAVIRGLIQVYELYLINMICRQNTFIGIFSNLLRSTGFLFANKRSCRFKSYYMPSLRKIDQLFLTIRIIILEICLRIFNDQSQNLFFMSEDRIKNNSILQFLRLSPCFVCMIIPQQTFLILSYAEIPKWL